MYLCAVLTVMVKFQRRTRKQASCIAFDDEFTRVSTIDGEFELICWGWGGDKFHKSINYPSIVSPINYICTVQGGLKAGLKEKRRRRGNWNDKRSKQEACVKKIGKMDFLFCSFLFLAFSLINGKVPQYIIHLVNGPIILTATGKRQRQPV